MQLQGKLSLPHTPVPQPKANVPKRSGCEHVTVDTRKDRDRWASDVQKSPELTDFFTTAGTKCSNSRLENRAQGQVKLFA